MAKNLNYGFITGRQRKRALEGNLTLRAREGRKSEPTSCSCSPSNAQLFWETTWYLPEPTRWFLPKHSLLCPRTRWVTKTVSHICASQTPRSIPMCRGKTVTALLTTFSALLDFSLHEVRPANTTHHFLFSFLFFLPSFPSPCDFSCCTHCNSRL